MPHEAVLARAHVSHVEHASNVTSRARAELQCDDKLDDRKGKNVCFFIFIQLSDWGVVERTKMPKLLNGSKMGFEPGLSRLQVRHSTTELPRSTSNVTSRAGHYILDEGGRHGVGGRKWV